MCWISEWALYCVRTKICRMPEFTQFESGKSMIRYLPPNGAAGFARFAVRSPSREPRPPAMITAIVLRVRLLTKRPERRGFIEPAPAVTPCPPRTDVLVAISMLHWRCHHPPARRDPPRGRWRAADRPLAPCRSAADARYACSAP